MRSWLTSVKPGVSGSAAGSDGHGARRAGWVGVMVGIAEKKRIGALSGGDDDVPASNRGRDSGVPSGGPPCDVSRAACSARTTLLWREQGGNIGNTTVTGNKTVWLHNCTVRDFAYPALTFNCGWQPDITAPLWHKAVNSERVYKLIHREFNECHNGTPKIRSSVLPGPRYGDWGKACRSNSAA